MLCQQSPQPVLSQANYSQSSMNPMNTLNPQATLPVNSQVDNTFNFNVDIRADASINLDIDTSFGEFISQNDMSQLLATTDPQTPLAESSFKLEPQTESNQEW